MKAKVIATGEIVEVIGYSYDSYHCKNHKGDESWYLKLELEFLEEKHIDWEQRRFELVKATIPILIQLPTTKTMEEFAEFIAKASLKYADAVIEKLKEE